MNVFHNLVACERIRFIVGEKRRLRLPWRFRRASDRRWCSCTRWSLGYFIRVISLRWAIRQGLGVCIKCRFLWLSLKRFKTFPPRSRLCHSKVQELWLIFSKLSYFFGRRSLKSICTRYFWITNIDCWFVEKAGHHLACWCQVLGDPLASTQVGRIPI